MHEIANSPDRRNLVNSIFLANPNARSKTEIILGVQPARELEAFVRVENIMNMTKEALGNSQTSRFLAQLGLAGGAGGIAGAGAALLSGAAATSPKVWIPAALIFGARMGMSRLNRTVAEQVGELLASNNPAKIRLAAVKLGRNPGMLRALRNGEAMIARAVGQQGSQVGTRGLAAQPSDAGAEQQ